MAQHYSDPKREAGKTALPDVETFEVWPSDWEGQCPNCEDLPSGALPAYGSQDFVDQHKREHLGWYWWTCLPGCLPDSDAYGPYETEAEALADARSGQDDESEGE